MPKKNLIIFHIFTIRYSKKSALQKHIISIHDEANAKPIPCNICGSLMANSHSLTRHIHRQHHPHIKFDCTICEKSFKRQLHLNEHMATHTGIPLYKCEYCSKTFSSSSSICQHKGRNHPIELKAEREKRFLNNFCPN